MGKMLVSVGTLLVYSSFVVILSFLIKTSYDVFENSFISRQLMTLIAILGGGVYCQVMPSFFANFVNESVSAAEGRNSLRGAKAAGGMLKSGLAGGMLALGVGKAAKERAERKYGNDPRYANRSGAMRVAPNAAKATDATGGSAGGDTNDGGGGSSPRMRRTGAMGAVGKVIRGASSMVSLGGLGAAVVLGALGHSGSKTRLHQSGERIKKGIGDTKGRFKTA